LTTLTFFAFAVASGLIGFSAAFINRLDSYHHREDGLKMALSNTPI
jgi:hypothetical protein